MTAIANMPEGLRLAIDRAGSSHKLAQALGIKQQSLWLWRKVPAERVIAIERITGVPREQLRPDLYPPRQLQRPQV